MQPSQPPPPPAMPHISPSVLQPMMPWPAAMPPGMFVPPGLFPGMAPPPFVSAAARAASFAAPGSAAARLPPWVLPTFAEACRRLVRHQGLPFDDIDVAEMMDRIRE